MIARLALALSLALALTACGVKNRIDMPPGAAKQETNKDPSQPPQPLGQ